MLSTTDTFDALVYSIMKTPIDAVVTAEQQYLQIWYAKLSIVKSLVDNSGLGLEPAMIKALLDFTPTMKFAGNIDVAATVRLTSVSASDT